ncbi:Uncharacterised protein [Streptococcus pneumoniae]|nr:Uncharacterised protein [Streptococcus pneumoniae]
MSIKIETVLDFIHSYIESKIWDEKFFKSKGNDNGFENLIDSIIPNIKLQFPEIEVELITGHHFPDMNIFIDEKKYGVELKSSQKGTWTIPGNSIFESISENDYKEIYILFGSRKKDTETKKFVLQYNVKYRKYWQATSSIAVTHSPRFVINMDAKEGVFSNLEEYNHFREMLDEDKASFAQKILREKADGVKWYVAPEVDSIKVTNFSELPNDRKHELLTELFVLFPTDVLRKKNDYTRCTNYLIDKYYIYSKSLRDVFSAGGKIEKNGVLIPQTLQTFINHKQDIALVLENSNEEFQRVAYSCWGMLPKTNFISDYRLVVDNWISQEFKNELAKLGVKSIFDLH